MKPFTDDDFPLLPWPDEGFGIKAIPPKSEAFGIDKQMLAKLQTTGFFQRLFFVDSEIKRRYRAYLDAMADFRENVRATRLDFWLSLSAREFEYECARVFAAVGFEVKMTAGSGDRGMDIQVQMCGNRSLVQCKARNAVCGPNVVLETFGAMHAHHCSSAFICTTRGFSKGAHAEAAGKPICLLHSLDMAKTELFRWRDPNATGPSLTGLLLARLNDGLVL